MYDDKMSIQKESVTKKEKWEYKRKGDWDKKISGRIEKMRILLREKKGSNWIYLQKRARLKGLSFQNSLSLYFMQNGLFTY